jgi:mRNA-degrading endonuclease RelE of RelBE toxin-antitoxin system
VTPGKTVVWATNAQAQLAAIDRQTALGILHAIDDYLTSGVGEVKKLRPPRKELRLRVGDYRVFFLFHDPASIEILGVKHRRDAYR